MEWSEIDLESAWWTIPKEKSKNKLAHRVPLSSSAVRILTSLKEAQGKLKNVRRRKSAFVFQSPRYAGEHINEVQKAWQRLRPRAAELLKIEPPAELDITPHDLRRTAASLMTGMGVSRLVVGKILNHVEQGITRVYDRHSYDKEKRDALDEWASRLAVIVSGLKEVRSV